MQEKMERFGIVMCLMIVSWMVLMGTSLANTYPVGVTLVTIGGQYNYTLLNFRTSQAAGGENVSVCVDVSYTSENPGMANITMDYPTNWEHGFNWSVNESGILLPLTLATKITWTANFSYSGSVLCWLVDPPELNTTAETITVTNYTLNLTVESNSSFTNVSANVSINDSFTFWWLWWQNGSSWQDMTVPWNLDVSGSYATFYGFTTSVQNFSIEGRTSCTEQWSCSGWSSVTCGTRTCTETTHCGTTNTKPSESLQCEVDTPPGGGGGGGAAPVNKADFTAKPALIKIILAEGESTTEKIRVNNTGEKALTIAYSQIGLDAILYYLVVVGELTTDIQIGELEFIPFTFDATEAEPGIYTGELVFSASGVRKSVEVIVEVQSKNVLFDIDLEVPAIYSFPHPGDMIEIVSTLYNLAGPGRQDVYIIYLIKDMKGNVVVSESETIAVETKASTRRTMTLPTDIEPGTYIVAAEVHYGGNVGTSSAGIQVMGPEPVVDDEPGFISEGTGRLQMGGYALMALGMLLLVGIILQLGMQWYHDFRGARKDLRHAQRLIVQVESFIRQKNFQQAELHYLEVERIYRHLPAWARRQIYKKAVDVEKILAKFVVRKEKQDKSKNKLSSAIEEYEKMISKGKKE